MNHQFAVRIGPAGFRIGSVWRSPVARLRELYAGYPAAELPDFTVRLEPERPWRRWLRPSVAIRGDFVLPDAAPLPLAHGLLAAEMGMNLQMALGQRRFLLLHAASLERDGRALILTGASGSGKSTLAALLGEAGWRFMGDEFALLEPETGQLHAFPRPASLKNEAIEIVTRAVSGDRFGPRLEGTPKGIVQHLRPNQNAIERMDQPARPALVLFPRFGAAMEPAVRTVGATETFVRLTQASTNYVALGERGFQALSRLVGSVPATAIDFSSAEAAKALIAPLWAGAA